MKEKQKNVIIPALAAGFVFLAYLVMAALCIHDMQSAEGVGLLFALRAGKDRLWYDVAADSLGVLGLLLLVVVPCFRLGHRSAAALLRMLLAFLSFMPSLSMAYLLHPLEGGEELQLQQPLFLLQTLLPLLCLWAAVLENYRQLNAWVLEDGVDVAMERFCRCARDAYKTDVQVEDVPDTRVLQARRSQTAAALQELEVHAVLAQAGRMRAQRLPLAPDEVEKRIQSVMQAPAMPESWERRRTR